jgi:hypothetical protein
MTAATALAGPGDNRGHDRGYGRDDSRGPNGGRGRGHERGGKPGKSYETRAAQPNARGSNNRGGAWSRAQHSGNRIHAGRDSEAGPPHRRYRAPAKVVHKPVVVKKTVVVKRPAPIRKTVVNKRIVHKNVIYSPPSIKTGYRHGHGHGNGHYAPPPTRVIVVPQRRRYRNVWVVRDHGHRYYGYGHYRHDHDAYRWIAFTAITVALINNLSEYQQRAYEDAQIRATTAPVGETIRWNEAGAYGTVTPTREGTSSLDRYCREFQKTVTIGGRTEEAYGTACMQPDGAWEVVSNNGN